jgi:MFS family permease
MSQSESPEIQRERKFGIHYKWVALSNTTLGALIVSIDGSILIISLPAIFKGLGVNPLSTGNVELLLWLLLGYTIVTAVTVVTIGRLSDMYGRVRLYNIGFAIFSFASLLLYASSYLVHGTAGIISLTLLRLIQGLGGGFLFANSIAILTDAFPTNERGKALGFNQVAYIGGNLLGLLIGGVLAAIDWHLIFLISVPIGIVGTIWAYIALREIAIIRKNQKLDILGNITFAVSLTTILLSLIYGLLPYDNDPTGWANPLVQVGFGIGIALLALFVFIETKVNDPLFHIQFFRIRAFSAGILSMSLAALARGGLQFMLIIWLQGIWLPLHGISFIDTPYQAAIDMIPLIVGFLISGPVSGYLSDKYGARLFTTTGMVINSIGFLILASIPVNFNYLYLAITIFFMGVGQGMFGAPNTAAIMNSVQQEYRGVASGMMATLINVSFMFSLAIFFSLLIIGFSTSLPGALHDGLVSQNVSNIDALQISKMPPSAALFAALLGYNPMKTIIQQNVINSLPPENADAILGNTFFPNIISGSFMNGMRIVMYSGALTTFFAAIFSGLRGRRSVAQTPP